MKYKYHFVYKTINNINQKEYIGVHSTNNMSDDYLGSGDAIKNAIKKYGKENFTRTILKVFQDELSAFEYEGILVNENYINRCDTYNMIVGGKIPPKRYGKNHWTYRQTLELTTPIIHNIIKLYDDGWGLAISNISNELNLYKSTILHVLKENNIKIYSKKDRIGKSFEQLMGETKAIERKKKISEFNSGRKFQISIDKMTPEYRKQLSDRAKKIHTGRKRTQETKDKMSVSIKNSKKHKDAISNPEYKKKISEWMKKQLANPNSVYNSIECKNKMKDSRAKHYELNPKIKKEDMIESLTLNKSVAAALRYYCKKYGNVSRPTFDVYRKKYVG